MAHGYDDEPPPGEPNRVDEPAVRLAGLWWIDWPRRLLRRLPGGTELIRDGYYLVTVAPVAVLAPIATVAWFLLSVPPPGVRRRVE